MPGKKGYKCERGRIEINKRKRGVNFSAAVTGNVVPSTT